MSFITYRQFGGKEYAYELTSYRDPVTKKVRHKSKYLGAVIDKNKQIFKKKWQTRMEAAILDFGDGFIVDKFLEQTGFSALLKEIFGDYTNVILSLIYYRLCYNGAMMYAERWFEGNYSRKRFVNLDLSSQRISDYLQELGNEVMQTRFFERYMTRFSTAKRGVVIDGTSLPNKIHNPLTVWGRSGEEIDKQVRFLLAIDRDEHLPMFFRLLPGNIIDVTSLRNTLYELKIYGVKEAFVFLDAGFFSDENIVEMYQNNVDFVIRLPAGRTLYKQLIEKYEKNLEAKENMVRYGKTRGLFVKEVNIKLADKNAYAYIVMDPVRRGRELSRFLFDMVEDDAVNETTDYDIENKGIMIVVSSFRVGKEEIVPSYYIRQTAETFFGFSKDDLAIAPLRVHSLERIKGFLFLQFLTLIAFVQIKNKLGSRYTVEQILLSLRNLKCKIYTDQIMIGEVTKEQREIAETLEILLPKSLPINL